MDRRRYLMALDKNTQITWHGHACVEVDDAW